MATYSQNEIVKAVRKAIEKICKEAEDDLAMESEIDGELPEFTWQQKKAAMDQLASNGDIYEPKIGKWGIP